MAGWRPSSAGPNRALHGLQSIRNRARDAARNEWTAAAAERVWSTNLIGTGIIPRPGTTDPALKVQMIHLWDKWATKADFDGVLDFYGLQTLAVEAWRTSGEVFARLISHQPDQQGLFVPLQIQLLEADMLPLLDANEREGLPAGHTIRSGIERNKIGKRIAYWFHASHPNDNFNFNFASNLDLVRIPAGEILHLYKPLRPGQLRGLPASTTVLPTRRSVGNFDDAVLNRQELANLYTGFVTRPPESADPITDPIGGGPLGGSEFAGAGAPSGDLQGLEPGLIQELLPGESVTFSAPPDAGANYADFMRQQHLGIAAGEGLPHELLTGDLRDVSDRTLRVIINEFRRTCEQYQWQLIIHQFCQPIRAAVARAAVLAGELRPADAEAFVSCTWHPHAWPYIHPTQDVQAKKIELEAGLKSRSQLAAERGDDIEQTDAERAEDLARERRLKISPSVTQKA
jgi:lambda family phage portal protein